MGYAGAVTALAAVIIALAQSDAKRLLAYHSVSQIGYVVTAWGAALHLGPETPQGAALMTAAFLHALFHAMFKGLLFLTVGNLSDTAGERNVYRLTGGAALLRRRGERFPVTFLAFMTAALAITAIPPMNGYASKTALSYALKGNWEYYLLFAAGIGTMASFIKIGRTFFGKPTEIPVKPGMEDQTPQVEEPRGAFGFVLVSQSILALAVTATGIFGPWMYRFVLRMFASGAGGNLGYDSSGMKGLSLYSPSGIRNTTIICASGILLYFLSRTGPGKFVLQRIRERQRGFHGLLTSFTLGTLAIALWMYLG
jgi:multicomponent Na+:H+ antiporter subunit D